jgi:hypothetical protein
MRCNFRKMVLLERSQSGVSSGIPLTGNMLALHYPLLYLLVLHSLRSLLLWENAVWAHFIIDIIYCHWGRFQSVQKVPVNSPAALSRCSGTRSLSRTAIMCPQLKAAGAVSPAASSSASDSWMGP